MGCTKLIFKTQEKIFFDGRKNKNFALQIGLQTRKMMK